MGKKEKRGEKKEKKKKREKKEDNIIEKERKYSILFPA